MDSSDDLIESRLARFGKPDYNEFLLDSWTMKVLGSPAERASRDEVIALPVGMITIKVEHVLPSQRRMPAEPAGVIVSCQDGGTLILPLTSYILHRVGGGMGRRDKREESRHG